MPNPDCNVTDPIFDWAQRAPHGVALLHGASSVSYAALCDEIGSAADQLLRAGIRAGDRIGVSLPQVGAQYLVVCLALARMGTTQVSLPPGDPATLRRARVQSLGINAVVGDGRGLGDLAQLVPAPGRLGEAHAGRQPDARAPGGSRDWIIAQSSGTTAAPKNIAISHRAEYVRGQRLKPMFAMLPGERYLNLTSVRFQVGMAWALRCLSDGAAFVVPPSTVTANQVIELIERHKVGFFACTPQHLNGLLKATRSDAPRLPGLRILRCSTATLPVAVLEQVRRTISAQVHINYGTNETGPLVAAGPELLTRYPDCVGRPVAGMELQIVDDEGRPLPAGQGGDIRVRGAEIVPARLLAAAAGDAAAFRDGWFYPGDVGMLNDEGIVFFRGRSDEVMNFDGILVGPAEIEAVLARHPAVAAAAAFSLPSPRHQEVPAAAVVLRKLVPMAELRRYCKENLGIRAPWFVFRLASIPRNPMGKVLRRKLARLALARPGVKQRIG
jgi:acyl-coenzyme A synthetase/AMP-(fatty) acid ligase